jgi:hypothetical protein
MKKVFVLEISWYAQPDVHMAFESYADLLDAMPASKTTGDLIDTLDVSMVCIHDDDQYQGGELNVFWTFDLDGYPEYHYFYSAVAMARAITSKDREVGCQRIYVKTIPLIPARWVPEDGPGSPVTTLGALLLSKLGTQS